MDHSYWWAVPAGVIVAGFLAYLGVRRTLSETARRDRAATVRSDRQRFEEKQIEAVLIFLTTGESRVNSFLHRNKDASGLLEESSPFAKKLWADYMTAMQVDLSRAFLYARSIELKVLLNNYWKAVTQEVENYYADIMLRGKAENAVETAELLSATNRISREIVMALRDELNEPITEHDLATVSWVRHPLQRFALWVLRDDVPAHRADPAAGPGTEGQAVSDAGVETFKP